MINVLLFDAALAHSLLCDAYEERINGTVPNANTQLRLDSLGVGAFRAAEERGCSASCYVL